MILEKIETDSRDRERFVLTLNRNEADIIAGLLSVTIRETPALPDTMVYVNTVRTMRDCIRYAYRKSNEQRPKN